METVPTYRSARADDGKYLVTGVDGMPLSDLNGLTEKQATECAFHLNLAYGSGIRMARQQIRSALGL